MVSELDIVKADSPIFSGETTARTADASIFKLLLTGEDDASLVATKKKNLVRAELNAQLEMLVELIDQYTKKLPSSAPSPSEAKNQYDKLKVAISNSEDRISEIRQILGRDVDGRITIRREIAGAEERLEEIDSLLARFELLRQHYNSDLERLAAISEAGDMFAPLPRGVCPLCGSIIGDEPHENHIPSDQQVNSIRQAAEKEKNKIGVLLSSLADTVVELEVETESLGEVLVQRRFSLAAIASNIDASLQPSLEAEELNSRLLWERFSSVRSTQQLHEHISGLQKKRDDVMLQLNTAGPAKKVRASIPAENLQKFTDHFKTLLKAWHYPENERVHFDTKLNDFTLGARRRGDEGKGSRALTHSAFTIGLMLTCRSLDLMHPGLVVLDSPLVTFRDSDENDEVLTDNQTKIVVRDAFYRDLANCPKDCQIIILENEDPPDDLVESISSHHFTGSPTLGRKGFFPPRPQA